MPVITDKPQILVGSNPSGGVIVSEGLQRGILIGENPRSGAIVSAPKQGPAGPAGTGDKFYDHDQMIASGLWTVNHNLNKYPSTTVVDSTGGTVEGYIDHISPNQLTISFTAAFAGHAYCN